MAQHNALERAIQKLKERNNPAKKTVYSDEFLKQLELYETMAIQTNDVLKKARIYMNSFTLTSGKNVRINSLDGAGESSNQLGQRLQQDSGYAKTLLMVNKVETRIAKAQADMVMEMEFQFIRPLQNWLNTNCVELKKHKEILNNRRLDMDAAKGKNSKAPSHLAHLTLAKALHDQEKETVEKLLAEIPKIHYHHRLCFKAFLEAERKYHKTAEDLLKSAYTRTTYQPHRSPSPSS